MDTSKKCPLCGKPNGCKAGQKTLCWCHEVHVPAALLAKVPEEKKGKVCICHACITAYLTIKNEDV